MVFIGLNVISAGSGFKKPRVIHLNTKFIRKFDENEMIIELDDGTSYRIDEESCDVFLSAIYNPE